MICRIDSERRRTKLQLLRRVTGLRIPGRQQRQATIPTDWNKGPLPVVLVSIAKCIFTINLAHIINVGNTAIFLQFFGVRLNQPSNCYNGYTCSCQFSPASPPPPPPHFPRTLTNGGDVKYVLPPCHCGETVTPEVRLSRQNRQFQHSMTAFLNLPRLIMPRMVMMSAMDYGIDTFSKTNMYTW